MKKIAVLFSGRGTNFEYILKHLHKQNLEVAVAVSNNPNAGGIAFSKEYNIPLEIIDSKGFDSRESFDAQVVKSLQKYDVNLVVLAGFMRILTPVFTKSVRAINLHPSLLPRHKGLEAIERSYADEYKEGGVTVHFVTSELDGGEIVLQKSVAKDGLSFDEYNARIRKIEKEALIEAIKKVI